MTGSDFEQAGDPDRENAARGGTSVSGQFRTLVHWLTRRAQVPNTTIRVVALILSLGAAAAAHDTLVALPYFEAVPGTRHLSMELLAATKSGDARATWELLRSGADINVWTVFGRTPLRNAIDLGDVALTKLLIDAGADVDKQPYGAPESPVFAAVWAGSPELVEILVKSGANINSRTTRGATPLHKAMSRGTPQMVRLLLELGADATARDDAGETVLEAADAGSVDAMSVRLVLGAGCPIPDRPTGSFGMGPLDAALFHGNKDVARLLIDAGAHASADTKFIGIGLYLAILDRDDESAIAEIATSGPVGRNATPRMMSRLHLAAMHGRTRVVRFLLENGCWMTALDWVGRTPLGTAAFYGHVDVVEALLAHGCDPNGGRAPPLLGAVQEGHYDAARELLTAGANPNTIIEGPYGPSVLHCASRRGDVRMIELLLRFGAVPDVRDERNNNPLHVTENVDVWIRLVLAGAHPFDENVWDETPFAIVMASHDDSIALAILDERAPPKVNAESLRSAFPMVACRGSASVLERMIDAGVGPNDVANETLDLLRRGRLNAINAAILVRRGADVSSSGAYSELLHAACRQGLRELVELIVENGADVNAVDHQGRLPIAYALKSGDSRIIHTLCTHGSRLPPSWSRDELEFVCALFSGEDDRATDLIPRIDPTRLLTDDEHALSLAVRYGRVPVVCAMVGNGASVDSGAPVNRSILQEAMKHGSLDLVRFILEGGADPNANELHEGPALIGAVRRRSTALVDLLLKAGADPKGADRLGRTAIDVARETGQSDILTLLESTPAIGNDE